MKDSNSLEHFMLQVQMGWVSGSFQNIIVKSCDLSQVKFYRAEFEGVSFIDCHMPDVYIWQCIFHSVTFQNCQMNRSKLYQVQFIETHFLTVACSFSNWIEVGFLDLISNDWSVKYSTFFKVKFNRVDIKSCNGVGLDCEQVSLNEALVSYADFAYGLWQSVVVKKAHFYHCKFRHLKVLYLKTSETLFTAEQCLHCRLDSSLPGQHIHMD